MPLVVVPVAENAAARLSVIEDEPAKITVESLIADGIERAMAVYNGIDLREEKKDN